MTESTYVYPFKANAYYINCERCGKKIRQKAPTHKYCSECKPIVKKERDRIYDLNKRKPRSSEYLKNYRRMYYQKHRKEICEYHKAYYLKHKEELTKRSRIAYCSSKYNNCYDCPYDDCIKE